jgi:hypothetical protein
MGQIIIGVTPADGVVLAVVDKLPRMVALAQVMPITAVTHNLDWVVLVFLAAVVVFSAATVD